MADTAVLEMDRTWVYDKVIAKMGTHGRIIDSEMLDHIETCVLSMDIKEVFMADDVMAYLREIYGGPFGGPIKWISVMTIENTLETEFNTSSALKSPETRLCAVDYEYDWENYETEYWRIA